MAIRYPNTVSFTPNDFHMSHRPLPQLQPSRHTTQTPEFIFSVQCSLYKYDTESGTWTNLSNSRNCVVQLFKLNGINHITASQKRSRTKFFEYKITNKLYFENLDNHLYQLQDRNSLEDDIWGISFLVRNDGMNFANKFEDLIQYEPGPDDGNVPMDYSFNESFFVKEEPISMDDIELSTLAHPLQKALGDKNVVEGEYWLNILCKLPESHRRFLFELGSAMEDEGNLIFLNILVENLNENDRLAVKIVVPYNITVNGLKELFLIKYGIQRQLQKWITDNTILTGKDGIKNKIGQIIPIYLIIMNQQPLNFQGVSSSNFTN